MDRDGRLKRLKFRAWHRGVREADMLVGGYFDRWHESWDDTEATWFEMRRLSGLLGQNSDQNQRRCSGLLRFS